MKARPILLASGAKAPLARGADRKLLQTDPRPVVLVTLAADGTDQTASLQAQIDAAPNGTILVLPATGEYRIDGTVTIANRSDLAIRAAGGGTFSHYSNLDGIQTGAVDGNGNSVRSHWWIVGSGTNGVELRGISVRGPNSSRSGDFALYTSARAFEHAFTITGGCSNVAIEDCTVDSVHGDAFYIGGSQVSQNTDIIVRNCSGVYPGRQQIGMVNVNRCLIEDVDIRWGGRSGLDIEPNHDNHFVRNVVCRRVTMGSQSYPFVVGGDAGDSLPHNFNITLEDCVGLNASSAHTAVLASRWGEDLTVRGHVDLRQRSARCIDIGAWGGTVTIEDCVIASGTSTPTTYGVYFLDSSTCDVVLRNNTFNGAVEGADQLYYAGSGLGLVTTCGNVWGAGLLNDGACP